MQVSPGNLFTLHRHLHVHGDHLGYTHEGTASLPHRVYIDRMSHSHTVTRSYGPTVMRSYASYGQQHQSVQQES